MNTIKRMEYLYEDKTIELEKELNELDKFAIDFTSVLNELNIDSVFISGYVSILFGRSRSSENIDIFIEKVSKPDFERLWSKLLEKFECMNTNNVNEAYNDFLENNLAIRFTYPNEVMPNMELKFPKTKLDLFALNNKIKVKLNSNNINISPIELQIVFKLYLGSEKDIEDALFLHKVFKEKLNIELLEEFVKELNIKNTYERYIK